MINSKRRPTTAYTSLKFTKRNNKQPKSFQIFDKHQTYSQKPSNQSPRNHNLQNQTNYRPITSKERINGRLQRANTQSEQHKIFAISCANPDLQFTRCITQNPQVLTSKSYFFTSRQRCKTAKNPQFQEKDESLQMYVFETQLYRKNRVKTIRKIADKINERFDININPKKKISSQLHQHIKDKNRIAQNYKDDQNLETPNDKKDQQLKTFDPTLLQEVGSFSKSKNRIIKGFFYQKKNINDLMIKNLKKTQQSARQISEQKKRYHSFYNKYLQNFSSRKTIITTQYVKNTVPNSLMNKSTDQIMQKTLKGKTLQLFYSLKRRQ